MIYATYLLVALLTCYALWVFYLAVMNLKRVKDMGKLGKVALALGTPVLLIGWVLDFIVNVAVMSFILLELPREATVTARLKRLKRHKRESNGWRLKVTEWLVSELLDHFDPDGSHV